MFTNPLGLMHHKGTSDSEQHSDGALLLPLEQTDEVATQAEVTRLIQMTGRLPEARDKILCQGLIIRGLSNDSQEAYATLVSELVRH